MESRRKKKNSCRETSISYRVTRARSKWVGHSVTAGAGRYQNRNPSDRVIELHGSRARLLVWSISHNVENTVNSSIDTLKMLSDDSCYNLCVYVRLAVSSKTSVVFNDKIENFVLENKLVFYTVSVSFNLLSRETRLWSRLELSARCCHVTTALFNKTILERIIQEIIRKDT